MSNSAKKTILTFNRVLFVAVFIFVAIAISSYAMNFKIADENLLVDGNMEAVGTTSWTADNGGILSKETTSPYRGVRNIRITKGDTEATIATARQYILTIGKTYRVTGWARSSLLGYVLITLQNTPVVNLGADVTDWTYFDEIAVSGGTSFRLRNYDIGGVAGSWVEFDDVRVVEYTPPAKNADKQVLVDGNMEKAGTTDWTSLFAATLSKETTNPKRGTNWLKATNTIESNGGAYQEILTVGKTYRVTGWAKGDGVDAKPDIYQGSLQWVGTTSTDWQYFDITFVASSYSRLYLQTGHNVIGDYTGWDDVLVTEYTPPVQQSTLFKGLVGWWPLKSGWMQSATVVSDKTPYANHGTANGSPVVGSNYTTFVNTTSDYIDIGDTNQSIKSISFWLNPDTTTEDIIDLDGGTHKISVSTGTLSATGFDTPIIYVDGAVSSILATGSFQNVAITTATGFNASNFDIGKIAASYFDGDIKDVMIWNRVLTPAEVTQLYNTKF